MTAKTIPARVGWVRDWPRWTPYAAMAWSLVYAALGLYWAVSGRGFPYAPGPASGLIGPVAGRFGPAVTWTIVVIEGIPAAAVGIAMLRGPRGLRPFLIAAGTLLAATLLLMMTDMNLLILLGYTPYAVLGLLNGAGIGRTWLAGLIEWTTVHQFLCLIGGFLWLAATVNYARRSGDACLFCGRRDTTEGWNSPSHAARWGRAAVYVAMAVPVVYALTRFAWALGIPLGMSAEQLLDGQARGLWISGLFLAAFGLVGAALMLGLVQRWGEVFPRWMPGLAGRRVPLGLAVVPASIVSVLLMVGGIAMWSGLSQINAGQAGGTQNIAIVVGPVLLFPIWAVALAVATLGYYYRRRGPCARCGRGTAGDAVDPLIGRSSTVHAV